MSAMPFFAFLLKSATASWYSSLDAFFFSMPDTSLTTAGGATVSPSSAARAAAASAASANLAAFFRLRRRARPELVVHPPAERREHPAETLERLRLEHRLARRLRARQIGHARESLRDANE